MNRDRKILPVALLLEGRRCLVVGAGRAASRKIQNLLEAGAHVRCVAPEIGSDVLRLAKENPGLKLSRRPFLLRDLRGVFLAYAATDDSALNLKIVREAKKMKIISSAADENWPEGDLINPAVFRDGDFCVSVSTGGKSCRRSKELRDIIAASLAEMRNAELYVAGADFKSCPPAVLEKLFRSTSGSEKISERLAALKGVLEFTVLKTCNRIEFVGIVSAGNVLDEMISIVLGFDSLPPDGFYKRIGYDAFMHAAMLLAGLKSQNLGETQVVSQVKDALQAPTAGAMMRTWFDKALFLSRELRRATSGILKPVPLHVACADMLGRKYAASKSAEVAIIGTGHLGAALAEKLAGGKFKVTCFYREKRPSFDIPSASTADIKMCGIGKFWCHVHKFDAIILCTDSGVPIITAEDAGRLARTKVGLLMDLSFPRNIDPRLKSMLPGLELLGLEDFAPRKLSPQDTDELERLASVIMDSNRSAYEKIVGTFKCGRQI